jgi:hypothetical protein
MKYSNEDEYDGQWKEDERNGEGIFKEASTGKIQRILYEDDEILDILENDIKGLP